MKIQGHSWIGKGNRVDLQGPKWIGLFEKGLVLEWLSHNEQRISVFLLNRMYWTHTSDNSLATFYECQLNIVNNLLPVVPAFEKQIHFEKWSLQVRFNSGESILFSVVKTENYIKKSMSSVSMNWLFRSWDSFFFQKIFVHVFSFCYQWIDLYLDVSYFSKRWFDWWDLVWYLWNRGYRWDGYWEAYSNISYANVLIRTHQRDPYHYSIAYWRQTHLFRLIGPEQL